MYSVKLDGNLRPTFLWQIGFHFAGKRQRVVPDEDAYRRRDQTLAVRPCRRLLGALPQYVSESIRHRFSIFGAFAALVNRLPAIMLAIPWKPGLEFGFDTIPISSAYYRPLRSC